MLLSLLALVSGLFLQVSQAENATSITPELFRQPFSEINKETTSILEIIENETTAASATEGVLDQRLIQERTVLEFFALQHRLLKAVYGKMHFDNVNNIGFSNIFERESQLLKAQITKLVYCKLEFVILLDSACRLNDDNNSLFKKPTTCLKGNFTEDECRRKGCCFFAANTEVSTLIVYLS